QQDWAWLAAFSAWFAVLWAPEAVWRASEAAALAASAADLAADALCSTRSSRSESSWIVAEDVQPAAAASARARAPPRIAVEIFILKILMNSRVNEATCMFLPKRPASFRPPLARRNNERNIVKSQTSNAVVR